MKNLLVKNFKTNMSATCILILIFAIGATISVLPNAAAHDPSWNIPTWTYLSVAPSPIGVGQQAFVIMWLNIYPPTANGQYGDRWQGLTVSVTKPDGTTTTLGPFTSDPVGSAYTSFTPDQVGVYSFQAHFPGQKITGANPNPNGYPSGSQYTDYLGDNFLASTSPVITLTATQEPAPMWQSSPIPTSEFWSRPINGQNREWASIASDWLGGSSISNKYQPYGLAPDSGHILWAKPITFGGLTGSQFGDVTYYDGLSYENKFPSPVIIQGRLYYNEYPTPRYSIDSYPPGFYCVDLATGEVVYWKNATISFGQTYDRETPNEHGTVSYLWGTSGRTWHMFDPFNGNDLCTITNVPSGTQVTASDGSILIYQLGPKNAWLACWNVTTAIMYHSIQAGANYYWNFRPEFGKTYDGANGYDWNITLPASQVPSDAYVMGADSDVLLLTTGLATGPAGVGIGGTPATYVQCGISLSNSQPGHVLWSTTRTAAPGNVTITYGTAGSGVYVMRAKETMQWYGYSVTTGQQLWGPTDSQAQWDVYGMGGNIAGDTLYSCGYSGILYAYDVNNGNLRWSFSSGSGGFDVYYGNFPLSFGAIADGKVYLYSSEHSPSKPAWRGSSIICVDANSGTEVWRVQNWANGIMVADGYLVDLNSYDNQIYCFGKGQTETTVTAPDIAVPTGTTVLIQGTVTDQSPGKPGTPAISDANMNEWMNYLYEQQTKPQNVQGVPVHLTAVDQNGNSKEIGTVVSDMNGLYSTTWTPTAEGKYTIKAEFAGSHSYYASSAETALAVGSAASAIVFPTPAQSTTPPPVNAPPLEAPMATYLAIIIAVVVVIIVAVALVLRRRK